MKAIVQAQYGSRDVLEFRDVEMPIMKDGEVRIRVRAAAANIGDWHLLRGEAPDRTPTLCATTFNRSYDAA
jgi:NADPH:quinone reductase-like Zn-dependent oxidoreductase